MGQNLFDDAEVIYAYTRRQAIEDGVLVDFMQDELRELVRQAGFRFPIAMTTTSFSVAVATEGEELPEGQDIKGRAWDVLNMLRWAVNTAPRGTDTLFFKVKVWNGRHHTVVKLKAVCGPSDDGSPCITIMFPDED